MAMAIGLDIGGTKCAVSIGREEANRRYAPADVIRLSYNSSACRCTTSCARRWKNDSLRSEIALHSIKELPVTGKLLLYIVIFI